MSASERPLSRSHPGSPVTTGGKAPLVQAGADLRCTVSGVFYRALDPAHRAQALAGSRLAGRYSRADQPTLHLSSSPQGVTAAMATHGGARGDLDMMTFDVHAHDIVDLRESAALSAAGVDLADALAPWQNLVAAGAAPRSWGFRQRLEDLGAHGLIDPSRTRPGLWHLVLFTWNTDDADRVTPVRAPS